MIARMGNVQHTLCSLLLSPTEKAGDSQPWMTATTNRNKISGRFGHNTCSVVKIVPFGSHLFLCLPDFTPRRLPYWCSVLIHKTP